ncbi:hypothetical protein ETD86_18430 [Nonomuraea turkmeniaca]|uniref:PQQ-like beta-propeller repeat protein n=1 Tax=Nonomuraea turkmeniaca TaxID=103838 RepID=A0A5S4G3C8_9ACTN|nr:PQQ-binding-like beta-propeller repeat protein [Nonomuraea turkmeniaca]TMR20530.1 hypothetical protein ETD86_18430 [Nonomuraea turkmeniaca]
MLTRRRLLAAAALAPGAALIPNVGSAFAAAAAVEPLGSPLKDVLLIGGTVAPGPEGGRTLWSVSTGEPAKLNAVDPATGKTLLSQPLPGSPGSYAVVAAPDGTLYVGAYGSGFLYRRRPGPDSTPENLGRPLPSETYIWRLAVDDAGRLYGGTSPGGRVFGYEPRTGQTRDYGQLRPGLRYVRSIAVWGHFIYAGTEPDAHVIAIHTDTGAMHELPLPEEIGDGVGVTAYDLNAYAGRLFVRFGSAVQGRLGVYDISAGKWTDLIDGVAGLDVTPPGRRGEVYFTKDNRLTRYQPRTGELTPVGPAIPGRVANNRGIGWCDLDLRGWPGQTVTGLLWRGALFRHNPITEHSEIVQTDIPGEPVPIAALHAGPSGAVYAGGFLSGGIAEVDPGTGQASFHRFAQIESIREIGRTVWIGAYPDSRLYRYDPALPWSSPEYDPGPPGTADNPVKVVDLKAHHQVRARAMTDAGAHVAYGTMPDATTLSGALVIVDKATLEATVHRPVVTDQSIVSLAYAGGMIIGGTSIRGGYSVPTPTQTEARLFGWAVSGTGTVFEVTPVPQAQAIPALVVDPAGLLWGLADGQLFAFDVTTRQVVHRLQLAQNVGATVGELGRRDGGDQIYALVHGRLLFEVDLATRTSRLLLDRPAQYLAVHPDGRLFLANDTVLTRF